MFSLAHGNLAQLSHDFFFTLIWYSACKTQLDVGFQTWWPGLSTPLLPHHSEDGTFGILLIDWIRVIQLSHPDLCWLSNADSSKNCLWLQERLPLAIGSVSVLSRQRTWCSAIPVTAVILRFPNAFRPDVRHTELGLIWSFMKANPISKNLNWES